MPQKSPLGMRTDYLWDWTTDWFVPGWGLFLSRFQRGRRYSGRVYLQKPINFYLPNGYIVGLMAVCRLYRTIEIVQMLMFGDIESPNIRRRE